MKYFALTGQLNYIRLPRSRIPGSRSYMVKMFRPSFTDIMAIPAAMVHMKRGRPMTEFWELLKDPDITFLRTALIMGLLASLAFGMTGSLVVVKRISYVAGAVAHAVLGGIGAALYFQRAHGVEWLNPLLGAFVAALLAAVLISWIRMSSFEMED